MIDADQHSPPVSLRRGAMSVVEAQTQIRAPLRTVYDQWTQFESFPRFSSLVRTVEQCGPALSRWTIGIGPMRHEFCAEILEQHPDSDIRWRSLDGRLRHEGEVTFHTLDTGRTSLSVKVAYVPDLNGALSLILRRVLRSELKNFKEFIECLGETGDSWRGTIHDGRVQRLDKEPPSSPRWPHG